MARDVHVGFVAQGRVRAAGEGEVPVSEAITANACSLEPSFGISNELKPMRSVVPRFKLHSESVDMLFIVVCELFHRACFIADKR